MLFPFLGIVSGILMAVAGAGMITGIALLFAGTAMYEVLARIGNNPLTSFRSRHLHHIWVFLLFAGTGVTVTDLNRQEPLPDNVIETGETGIGYVREIMETTEGDIALVALQAIADTSGQVKAISPVKLLLHATHLNAEPDDYVQFPLDLIPITDAPGNLRSGYATHMNRKGIFYTCRANADQVTCCGHERSFIGVTYLWRTGVEEFIENTHLSKPVQNFLITLLLGDKSYLSEDTRRSFADAGVSHMLALSGMHVSLIVGILMIILFPLNIMGAYRWRYILVIPLIWGYTILTGLSPSTVRAAVMTTCIMLCILLERPNSGWNSLLIATFVILIFSPMSLFDIGLQLSFVCVAVLVIFAEYFNPVEQRIHPHTHTATATIIATLTATAASWVLTAYYFGTFPLLFLPANIIALPLLPLYVSLALIYFLFYAIGLNLPVLTWILDNVYTSFTGLLAWAGNDGETVMHTEVSGFTVIFWLCAILFLAISLNSKHRKTLRRCAAVSGLIAILLIPITGNTDRDAFIIKGGRGVPRITVMQGHNESTIIPETNAISTYRIFGKNITIADTKALPSDITDSCDYLVLTRSCTAELADIAKVFKPRMLVIHTTVPRAREKKLMETADSLHIRVHSIRLNSPLTQFASLGDR